MDSDAAVMYSDTWLYELENKESRDDLGFWQRVVEQYQAKRVLELAVGTGRILLHLARHFSGNEYQFTGLDASAPMIAKAQEKLAGERVEVQQRVRLLVGDMTSFCTDDAGGSYDLIYVPYNSMAHIHDIRNQISTFRNAAACLAPGGHFVVDVFHPNIVQLAESKPPTIMRLDLDLSSPTVGVSRLLRYITRQYTPDSQRERITFVYEQYLEDGHTHKSVATFDSHTYFPRELELLLTAAGLTISERWGSYYGDPFTDTSPLMIFGTTVD